MSKVALMLLLVVVGSHARAEEWVAVSRNEYATGYANPATIAKDGHLVKMWSLVDCEAISNFIGGAPFMSVKSQEEFDCQEYKLRTLAYSLYSGRMGKGEMVFSSANPGKWELILPGSKMEEFWIIACGKT